VRTRSGAVACYHKGIAKAQKIGTSVATHCLMIVKKGFLTEFGKFIPQGLKSTDFAGLMYEL
jgi:hypothetical protein